MTDCGAVHEWIDDHGFSDKAELIDFVSGTLPNGEYRDDRWRLSGGDMTNVMWGAFWRCVDEYDFDTLLKLVKVTFHTKKGKVRREVLRRIDKETGRYIALNLDPSTKARIRELLRNL